MKICDLYGAGYFYVPGTDTCMKIGGYVRFSLTYDNTGGNVFAGAGFGGVNSFFNRRDTQDLNFRSRVWMTGDVRSQTSMGALRSYYAAQFTNVGPGDTATGTAIPRAFIQLAGFTFGRTTSAFDTPDALSSLTTAIFDSVGVSTSSPGINAVQYTAQFGNGVSATLGLESPDQRRRAVVNLSRPANSFNFFTGALPTNSAISSGAAATAGGNVPDIVANIDVTQAWGSARLVGALHNASGDYYTGSNAGIGYVAPASCIAATPVACGSPGETWGYAFGGGFTITQIPGLPGDLFGITAKYSHGASGYTQGVQNLSIINGGTATVGPGTDGVFVNGSGIELTDVWYVTAAFQHNWAPNLKTSIYGGYGAVSYSSNARGWMCGTTAGAPAGATTAAPAGTGMVGVTNCNPDYSYWQAGSRVFQWTPVANLDIGLDLWYTSFNSAFAGLAATPAAGAQPAGIHTMGTNGVWAAMFQVQRSFWP